jgi:hypothetical protein
MRLTPVGIRSAGCPRHGVGGPNTSQQLWLSAALAIFIALGCLHLGGINGVGIELTLSTPIFCPFLRGDSTPLATVELTLSTRPEMELGKSSLKWSWLHAQGSKVVTRSVWAHRCCPRLSLLLMAITLFAPILCEGALHFDTDMVLLRSGIFLTSALNGCRLCGPHSLRMCWRILSRTSYPGDAAGTHSHPRVGAHSFCVLPHWTWISSPCFSPMA